MTKSLILYFSLAPDAGGQPVHSQQGTVYIRIEPSELDLLGALDAAKPRKDETVLNSILAP